MKQTVFFLILSLLIYIPATAQWVAMPVPDGGRYDDVFFLDDQQGWAVNSGGEIWHSTNGGFSWNRQADTDYYLRSIEFATPLLGFCGSVQGQFYKTTDGGTTWTDIMPSLPVALPGICGLSIPTPSVIYGCGIWSSPAYLIRSADAGATWSVIDMSAHASALVEVLFINADTGFVAGMANPATDGGVVLRTTDGGQTWTRVHHTGTAQDFIWKLQSPDGQHYYGSIQGVGFAPTRFIRSQDSGLTWRTDTASTTSHSIQCIGFLDTLRGWMGSQQIFLTTTDGGDTWQSTGECINVNRFFRVNDSTCFISGRFVYQYVDTTTTAVSPPAMAPSDPKPALAVSPNPVSSRINATVTLPARTYCQLRLLSATGSLVATLQATELHTGTYSFAYDMQALPAGTYWMVLHTHEGQLTRQILKQ